MSRPNRFFAGAALATVLLTGAVACGDDADESGVDVASAWARTSPMNTDAGAAYFTISSDTDVSIVAARVGDDVAGTVELHEVVPAGDHSEDDMAEDGMEMAMTMQQVPAIAVPAGGSVAFEPGGYHVMLLDLPDPLETGENFELTLLLDDDSEITVDVEVRENAP